jgi:transcription termination factor Rho
MYDILQLNDMLVPELLDIAEQLKIPMLKKLGKQDLVYKILDNQAIAGAKSANLNDDKGKRKRIIKTTTSNSTEEAVVESNGDEKKIIKKPPMAVKKEIRPEPVIEKMPLKKGRGKNLMRKMLTPVRPPIARTNRRKKAIIITTIITSLNPRPGK